MMPDDPQQEFLVLSRGQWDADKTDAEIQAVIDAFYDWYERLVADGQVQRGHRLAREGKVVSKHRIADGPFAEAKELIGGYWIVRAPSLDAAAELMSHNPTIACGLAFEVRPLEHQRASATVASNETPPGRRAGG
ncbi:MAG TPA: YciI family protein [Burkholderiaceae bacterium]|nr:YciI family protein [Burkholderiaceae bacterium]